MRSRLPASTLKRTQQALIRALGWLVLAAAASLALVAIHEEPPEPLLKTFFSLLLLLATLGACLAACAAMRRPRLILPMLGSIIIAWAGYALLLVAIWWERRLAQAEIVTMIGAGLFGLAIAAAHNGALSLVQVFSPVLRGLRIAVMVCAWSALACMVLGFLGRWQSNMGLMIAVGFLGAISVMALIAGTILTPLAALSAANKRQAVESLASRFQVWLGCPRCDHRQTVKPGAVRCANCGAAMLVEVEEPRCECGYLVYRLEGDSCPECGRPLARWDSPALPPASAQ